MSTTIGDWVNDLIRKAAEVKENSHSPYSRFRVGAALLCESGTTFLGCNVENAVYPVGVCAERSAICSAVSNGHKKFKAIAVICDRDDYITPCGMCRQSLQEFQINEVYCAKANLVDGKYLYRHFTLDQLLPYAFGSDNLQ